MENGLKKIESQAEEPLDFSNKHRKSPKLTAYDTDYCSPTGNVKFFNKPRRNSTFSAIGKNNSPFHVPINFCERRNEDKSDDISQYKNEKEINNVRHLTDLNRLYANYVAQHLLNVSPLTKYELLNEWNSSTASTTTCHPIIDSNFTNQENRGTVFQLSEDETFNEIGNPLVSVKRKIKVQTPTVDESAISKNDKDSSTYLSKRLKNNEAAKRSRDARKAKEDEINFRADFLEQENVQLKGQLIALKAQVEHLKRVLFSF